MQEIPNPEARVTRDPNMGDKFGNPVAHFSGNPSPQDNGVAKSLSEKTSEWATSTTNKWGAVWGHSNLHIVDGSLHVTNGGVNPGLTIMALAYRVSQHVADTLSAPQTQQPTDISASTV
ncbi:MAG: GMC oxidoreductase [Chloroflexia bacterium]